MNFALLGADAAARPLLAAIAANSAHRLSHAVHAGDFVAELLTSSPGLQIADGWDVLMTNPELDAVIVAGGDAEILEGARQLAAAGKSLIVFPNAEQGTTWFYELGLIRDDGRISLIPVFTARFETTLQQFRQTIVDGSIGKLLQLQLERIEQVVGERSGAALLSAAAVERALLPDVDLLRSLGGDYSRVTSLQSGLVGDRFSQALNTLSGDGLPEALWTMKGVHAASSWKLTATGESGTLVFDCAGDFESCRLTRKGAEVAHETAVSTNDSGHQQLQHCVAALSGTRVEPDWADLTRAADICDGARRSIRRRRTIDLHFESTSERSQFKTHMTAIGCSLLSLTLLGVVFVLIAGTLLDPRDTAEIKADHAKAIFYVEDFAPSTAEFAAPVETRMKELAVRMRGASFPVLVENDPPDGTFDFGNMRREAVVEHLQQAGANDAEQRTEVVSLKGRGFRILMLIARLLVFVPLGLFLVLQLLLFVARPGSSATKTKQNAEP